MKPPNDKTSQPQYPHKYYHIIVQDSGFSQEVKRYHQYNQRGSGSSALCREVDPFSEAAITIRGSIIPMLRQSVPCTVALLLSPGDPYFVDAAPALYTYQSQCVTRTPPPLPPSVTTGTHQTAVALCTTSRHRRTPAKWRPALENP